MGSRGRGNFFYKHKEVSPYSTPPRSLIHTPWAKDGFLDTSALSETLPRRVGQIMKFKVEIFFQLAHNA